MKLSLSRKEFTERCRSGTIPPLAREIPFRNPADIYPVVRKTGSMILQSIKGPERIARYSFIVFDPYMEYKVKNGVVEIKSGDSSAISYRRPLTKLREIVMAYPQMTDASLPPFQGGAVGLLSYDFVHYFERLPRKAQDDLLIPDAHFLIIDRLISFDHKTGKAWIVVAPGARETKLGYNDVDKGAGALFDSAVEELGRLDGLINDKSRWDVTGQDYSMQSFGRGIGYEMTKSYYIDMVKRVKEYIRAGDIFQANIAQRFSAYIGGADRWALYQKLSRINPAPFAAFADFGDYEIVSSSPERLIRLRGSIADTRPIAGTRPRGKDYLEDESMRKELLLNEKERAEHIMLIDLERNDLGRVCDYGSVAVDELMITEDYSHVIHIVSNVKGRLSVKKDSFDLLRAVFPGGTITGVPKVRCMEIIDELEPVTRGPYTGSLGYFGFTGEMDMNIIIRTFVCKDDRAYIHAGAGIVADSDPAREYAETLKKAEALMKTIVEVGSPAGR